MGGGVCVSESGVQPAIGGQQCDVTLRAALQNKSVVCSGSWFTNIQWCNCNDIITGAGSLLAYTRIYWNGRERRKGYFYAAHFASFQGYIGVCPRPEHVLLSHRQLFTGLTETYLPTYRLSDSLLKVDKLIVPKVLQSEMLKNIYETPLGIVRCKSRARQGM